MRDKLLCFIIDNNHLFLDCRLVDFNDIPIFFVCKDVQNNYYIALCTDVDASHYIVIPTSDKLILKMLHQETTMRELYNEVSFFWDVDSHDNVSNDVVHKYPISQLDLSALPKEGAYYSVPE